MAQCALPRRPYGKDRLPLSVIGFGGILVMNEQQDVADRLVAAAVERGVNYFDVAPSYGDAEIKLGPALAPFRKNCFLACKTGCRDAAGARAELEQSFQRLRTDYFDLYQLHGIVDVQKDVEAVFAPGGAMEVILEARRQGRIRHVGFSAHSIAAAHRAMDLYDFDSVLLPVNFATFYAGDFGPSVIARAVQKNMSVLALKTLARQKRPEGDNRRGQYPKCWYEPLTDPAEQDLAVRFTLGQPVTAALPPGEAELFWRAVEIAERFAPLTAPEQQRLEKLAADLRLIFRA